jgi:uncharacterized membrane protein
MATGQHRGAPKGNSPAVTAAVIGLVSIFAGFLLLIAGVAVLLRYSASEDPGALPTGGWLALAGVVMICLPAGFWTARFAYRETVIYRAWKATLTPVQRTWVTFAEAAAFWGGHELWKHHNRHESARLTKSVMGPERDQ